MKKILLLLAFSVILQWSYSQQTDSLNVVKDTIVAPTPSAVKATPADNYKKDQRPIKDRIGFGLGASLWITSNENYFEVAPTLAYRFPKRLITGAGFRYIYRDNKTYDVNLNSYGPLLFARINLLKKVYFWTEYEYLNTQYPTGIDGDKSTTSADSWFLGLGYTKSVGKKGKGGLGIQILYNPLYNDEEYSPYYSSVIYRIGYFF